MQEHPSSHDGGLAPVAFCVHCQNVNPIELQFCEQCGSPLRNAEFDMVHSAALKDARKWIGRVALIYLLSGLLIGAVLWASDGDPDVAVGVLVINGGFAALQGGMWWWAKSAPFPAAVVSLSSFLALLMVTAVFDPRSIGQGLIIKILVIAALVKAVRAGLAVRRLQTNAARGA